MRTAVPVDAPLDPKTKQLVREAKIGLTICVLLVGVFFYVTWHRVMGDWDTVPQHVKNAPIAQDMAEIYREEFIKNKQVGPGAFDPVPSTAQVNDSGAKPIVSKTVPQTNKPITFNDLRSKPTNHFEPKANKDPNVKPVKFETDTNDFQVSQPKTNDQKSEPLSQGLKPKREPGSNNNPFATKPNRHVFEIKDFNPSVPAPQQLPKSKPESQPESNSFQIRDVKPQSDPITEPINVPSAPKPESSTKQILDNDNQDFVPMGSFRSGSGAQTVSARSSFQVQVEPASATEPEEEQSSTRQFRETLALQPKVESFVPIKPVKHEPKQRAKRLDDPNEFMKSMPTSPTSLEPESRPDDFVVSATESSEPVKPALPVFDGFRDDTPSGNHNHDAAQEDNQIAEVIDPPLKWDEDAAEKSRELRRENAIRRGVYLVEENETLWSIAQTVYEDGRLFRALYELNRNQIPDANVLQSGIEIATPPLSELVANWSDSVPEDLRPTQAPADVYITKKGDTLFHVARVRLGQASRFDELLTLNQSKLNLDTNHLTELPTGMKLKLPADQ